MDILIGILIGALISASFAFVFWFLCVLCNLNSDKLNLCTKMTVYSLLVVVISFMGIILIKVW